MYIHKLNELDTQPASRLSQEGILSCLGSYLKKNKLNLPVNLLNVNQTLSR